MRLGKSRRGPSYGAVWAASLLAVLLVCGLTVGSCGTSSNSWTNLQPSGSTPSARFGEALLYIPESKTLLMFGGASAEDTPLNDAWEYNRQDNRWTDLSPSGAIPPARYSMAAAYDPEEKKMVIFGGMGAGGMMLDDTWAYDVAKNEWTKLTPTSSPSPRYQAKMVHDPSVGSFILFGGAHLRTTSRASFRQDFSDTWTFDLAGQRWTSLSPSGTAPPFGAARETLVWDGSTGRTLLFVGAEPIPDVAPLREEDWLIYGYDSGGNTWAEEPRSPMSPPISERYALALDSTLCTAVLFGGTDAERDTRGETWVFDLESNTWSRVLTGGPDSPPKRVDSGMVYAQESRTMILFGGRSGEGKSADLPNDTWEYTP